MNWGEEWMSASKSSNSQRDDSQADETEQERSLAVCSLQPLLSEYPSASYANSKFPGMLLEQSDSGMSLE